MFCKQCGNEITEGSAFCVKCGASQSNQTANNNFVNSSSNRFESRVVQIHPANEMATIKKFESFGWELNNSQTVDTKESHLERGLGGSLMSVTERETYIKLTFRRYLDHPNYKKLVVLETEYDTLEELEEEQPKQKKWPIIVAVLCWSIGIGSLMFRNIITAIMSAIVFVITVKQSKKYKKEYLKELEEWQNSTVSDSVEQANILEEAKKLL